VSRADELAAAYQAVRARLIRVAYAVLSSHTEAEDVVAETWLKLADADRRDPIRDVEAWAVVAVSRGALDTLRLARVRRESYVGPWLPEPVLQAADPAERVTLDSTVSYALLVVLESLTPGERVAFVLHDLFDMPFPEVADVVGRTPEAVRQLASRARAHVRAGTPRVPVTGGEHDRTVLAFLAAAAGGNLAELVSVLDPRVTLVSDGNGREMTARRPVLGAETVAAFILHWAGKLEPGDQVETVRVNDALGLAHRHDGALDSVLAFTVAEGRIVRIDIVRAPEKLPGGRSVVGRLPVGGDIDLERPPGPA
jgi:RNA polymerase sigma-70 factor, ECF subfamily